MIAATENERGEVVGSWSAATAATKETVASHWSDSNARVLSCVSVWLTVSCFLPFFCFWCFDIAQRAMTLAGKARLEA